MHELTRVRAYARLIVAIVGDDLGSSEARSLAIDSIVDRVVATTPDDTVCHAPAFGMVWCEGCASR